MLLLGKICALLSFLAFIINGTLFRVEGLVAVEGAFGLVSLLIILPYWREFPYYLKIMLVIIGMSSALLARNSLSADQVSANVRAEAQASEAAQIALAYCETEATKATADSAITIKPQQGTPVWKTFSHWMESAGSANAPVTLTEEQLATTTTAFKANKMPQCMAEYETAGASSDQVVVVTARGFSPDYSEDTDGRTTSGSVVWVQSILRLATP